MRLGPWYAYLPILITARVSYTYYGRGYTYYGYTYYGGSYTYYGGSYTYYGRGYTYHGYTYYGGSSRAISAAASACISGYLASSTWLG